MPLRPFVRNLRPDSGIPGARDLTGGLVYDAAGDYADQIVAIKVDTRIGYVAWAVSAVGGFLRIDRRRVAVPWSMVMRDARYKRCSLSIGQDKLMVCPGFRLSMLATIS